MRFLILGPLDVRDVSGEPLALGGRRQRTVLAALLARAGRSVTVAQLCEDVWGDTLPVRPEATLRTYVSRLRAALGEPDRITRHGVGYRIEVAAGELDVQTFERTVADGRAHLEDGDVETAARLLRDALALWRGTPVADLDDAPLLSWLRPQLQEQRFAALEDRIEADIACGRGHELIGELQALVEQHPLREQLVAQLMRVLYRSGRQADALAAFAAARDRLVDDLGVEPSAELVALHERILRQDLDSSPPPQHERAATTPPAPLPQPLSSFVGRDPDLSGVDALLRRRRLVTLTGVGGSGKTRLALEVARRRADHHRGGVWFVPLASLDEPTLVARTIASALGLQVGHSDPARELAAHLQTRDLLLVIDNCEHLRSPVAALLEWLLGRCVSVSVLATSREPLDVAGEHVWRVPPLRAPPTDADLQPPAALRTYESVRLFEERAGAAAGFALDADTGPAVARICRRLAGVPLAIELAAARVRSLSCIELADRLERSIDLLRSPSPTAGERHRTLQATLDWSHGLLHRGERLVLRRLAVFRAPFPLDAVEAVASPDGGPPRTDVIDAIDRLVACSLLETHADRSGRMRYRLLEPVRLYALDRLATDDVPAAIRTAHARWWIQQTAAAGRALRHKPGAHRELTAWFRESVDDLRAAFNWSLSGGSPELAHQLAGSSYLLFSAYGLSGEGISLARRTVARSDHVPLEVRAAALAGLGLLEAHAGQLDAAGDHARQAMRLFRRTTQARRSGSYADTLNVLAHIALWRPPSDPDAAERLAAQAIDWGTEHDDGWAFGYGRSTLAHTMRQRGDLNRAHDILRDLLGDLTARDDPVGIVMTNYNLAVVELERQHYTRARSYLEAALETKNRSGVDPFGRGATHIRELHALAEACLGQGDRRAARRYATQGLNAANALENHHEARRFQELLAQIG